MPGRKHVLLFRGWGRGERYKRHQPYPPAQQLDGLTIRDVRRLRQSLVRLRVVQTDLAIPRPPNGGLSPLWMLHQRATLDPLGERATVGLALATFLGLGTYGIADDARQTEPYTRRVSSKAAAPPTAALASTQASMQCASQTSASFLPVFLRPNCSRKALVCSPACYHGAKLTEFCIKPVFPHLQRRKLLIPTLGATGCRFDVFHYKNAHRKKLAEQGSKAQLPLPAGPGGRRGFFLL